ncbi:MAG: hypothetical protein L3J32_04255 [Rhizobiaceae bacterium]|nr:hypothetical protein [Rhizobiaceae bacterium]
MIKSVVLAISAGLVMLVPAQAQNIDRYDKNIEEAAVKHVAENIGELRGLILVETNDVFVKVESFNPKLRNKTIINPPPYRKSWQPDPVMKPLPPMVMSYGIDPFVTGVPFKFDSKGRPMSNHQEYPRPTAMSVAKSLIEAIEINPYPGE